MVIKKTLEHPFFVISHTPYLECPYLQRFLHSQIYPHAVEPGQLMKFRFVDWIALGVRCHNAILEVNIVYQPLIEILRERQSMKHDENWKLIYAVHMLQLRKTICKKWRPNVSIIKSNLPTLSVNKGNPW